jgi:hypothetical protein
VKSARKEKNSFFNKDFDPSTRIRETYKVLQNELLSNPELLKELGEYKTKALEAYAETEKQVNVEK